MAFQNGQIRKLKDLSSVLQPGVEEGEWGERPRSYAGQALRSRFLEEVGDEEQVGFGHSPLSFMRL